MNATWEELKKRFQVDCIAEFSQGLKRLLFERMVAKLAAYRKYGCGSLRSQATQFTEREQEDKEAMSVAEEKGL